MLTDTETPVSIMSSLITAVGSIVTGATTWIGDYLEMITTSGNELLLLFALLPIVGLGIGLLQRLLRVN